MSLDQEVPNESVYLEGCTRLLLETVQAQRATIERQQDRICVLERELTELCEELQN